MNHIIMDSQILSTLMSCGRLTDFRFNQDLTSTGGKSNSLECGSLVHVFLEYYYKGLRAGKMRVKCIEEGFEAAKLYLNGCEHCIAAANPPEGQKIMPCAFHQHGDFTGCKNTPDTSEKNRLGWQYVFQVIMQYLDKYKADSWVPLEIEHVKGTLLYEDAEISVIWKAKFDLIVDTNQQVFPVDHKTMSQRRPTLSLNNQFMGQCILTNSRNMVVNKIGFQKSLSKEEQFERVMISYSKDRLEEWRNVIVPYWARQMVKYNNTGYWPPNFTHCENKYGICPFKEVCESDRNMRAETIKLNFIKGKTWDISND